MIRPSPAASSRPSTASTGSALPDALTEALRIAERAGADPRIAELNGDLHYLHGDWDAALTSYAEACSLGDAGSPRLARKRGIILYLRGRLDEAEEVFAAARLDGTDPAEEAQVLAWRAAVRWVRSDVAGCEELIEPAEAAATAAGDDAALAAVHTTRAMIAAFQADRRANEWSYRKALDHAERAGDVIQMIRIHTNMGSHFSEEGSYPEAVAELDTAIGLAELAGSDSFTGHAYANRGDTLTRMGRLDDALRDLRQAQRIWERLRIRRRRLRPRLPRRRAVPARTAVRGPVLLPAGDRARRAGRRRAGSGPGAGRHGPGDDR